ncbi:MAG: MerR family DNA-binding transcriptional regulator [OCS116 cluster bacterium]|uniref:MerR family transcriptional regulator n=1 Tax=OCS116 cluster bacterium TaxID=2030921 RepID=A0A2A4Z9J8_9PROT|nr:MerR family DNA-binding transcriptional regulator [OCS116 cluster bacterium]
MNKPMIPIRQLTDEFGITTRTLRFYEDQGLLTPERNGRNRIFSEGDRTRLKLILRGKRMGFSLAKIRVIIDMYEDKSGELQQLNHLHKNIIEQRQSLMQKLADITESLDELGKVEKGCVDRMRELQVTNTGDAT